MNALGFGSQCLRAPSLVALAIFAIVCCLALSANASGQTREHTLRWVQPEGPEPSGYVTYLGAGSGVYSEVLDLGPVDPDPDGTRRATLVLDAYTSYYVAISAYNDSGESPLSDEVFSPSDACLSLSCDDGNPCTSDDCIADGCIHTPLLDGAQCDPGDGGHGLCSEAFCQPVDCLLDVDCDDGDACNGSETCSSNGLCISEPPLSCGDGNPCTADDCSAGACTHTPLLDGAACDPGDGGNGLCSEAFCQPVDCLLDVDCNDGDACNGLETCSSGGRCISEPPLSCGEPTQCQAPACDPVLGCVLFDEADGTPCSDGNKWTRGDQCQSGVCVGRSRKNADRSRRGKALGRKK